MGAVPDEVISPDMVGALRPQTDHVRECLAIRIDRKLNATAAIGVRTDLSVLRGVAGRVRPDNGPDFIATAVRDRIDAAGAKTACIEPLNRPPSEPAPI